MEISLDDFSQEIKRLHIGFLKNISDGFMADVVSAWFDMFSRSFPDTSVYVLKGMVDKAIDTGERFPSYSQFKALRQGVISSLPKVAKSVIGNCGFCDGHGVVIAWHVIAGMGPRNTTFRCPYCDEWKAPCVAVWSEDAKKYGYTLGRMPRDTDQPEIPVKSYVPKTVPGYDNKAKFEEARQQSLGMDAIRAQGRQGESFREEWY